MENQNLTKVIIKIRVSETSHKWVHLCYIPQVLFDEYREKTKEGFSNLNELLSRWVKEDFNVDLKVDTYENLEALKCLVKVKYKELYPEIFLDQPTDRQGWLRVWLVKKIREELKSDGK